MFLTDSLHIGDLNTWATQLVNTKSFTQIQSNVYVWMSRGCSVLSILRNHYLNKSDLKAIQKPWLPPWCSSCRQWGHSDKNCAQNKTDVLVEKKKTDLQTDVLVEKKKTDLQTDAQIIQNQSSSGTPQLEETSSSPASEDTATLETDNSVVAAAAENTTTDVETKTDAGWSVVQRTGRSAVPQAIDLTVSSQSRTSHTYDDDSMAISPSRYDALKTISEDGEEEGEITESGEESNTAQTAGKNLETHKPMIARGSQTRSKSQKKQMTNRAE